MKKALQVAMFSLFTVIGFNAQANEHHHETMSEAQPQVISATGVVKGIDLESKKITIHHDPIAAVNWPEMTMRFTITPQTKMSEIKTGDKVAFNFVQQGNLSLPGLQRRNRLQKKRRPQNVKSYSGTTQCIPIRGSINQVNRRLWIWIWCRNMPMKRVLRLVCALTRLRRRIWG